MAINRANQNWPETKQRITVQAISMVDGSTREVVANVPAETEQAAVDKLFSLSKDEIGYRFLGERGIIPPSAMPVANVNSPTFGEWWTRS